MAQVPFKYYLHDSYSSYERAEYIAGQTGVEMTEEMIETIGRPFYEVELSCVLDTETGKVTIVGVMR